MADVRVFGFPGTIWVYGANRVQAAVLLGEAETQVVNVNPAVCDVSFSKSHDRGMLARRGIDVEGEPASESVRAEGSPPTSTELGKRVNRALREEKERKRKALDDYAEDRRIENAELASQRARERAEDREAEG